MFRGATLSEIATATPQPAPSAELEVGRLPSRWFLAKTERLEHRRPPSDQRNKVKASHHQNRNDAAMTTQQHSTCALDINHWYTFGHEAARSETNGYCRFRTNYLW